MKLMNRRSSEVFVKAPRLNKMRAPISTAIIPDEEPAPKKKLKTIFRSTTKRSDKTLKVDPQAKRFELRAVAVPNVTPPDGEKPGPFVPVLFPPANHMGYDAKQVARGFKQNPETGNMEQIFESIPQRIRALKPVTVRVTQGDERNGYGVIYSLPSYLALKPFPRIKREGGSENVEPEVGMRIRFAGGTALTPAKVVEVL